MKTIATTWKNLSPTLKLILGLTLIIFIGKTLSKH